MSKIRVEIGAWYVRVTCIPRFKLPHQSIEIEGLRISVVKIKRQVSVIDLRGCSYCPTKVASTHHLVDQATWNRFALFIQRKLTQRIVVPNPFLKHLRRRLDKIALHRHPCHGRPLLGTREHVMQQMAELMQESLYLTVLHQTFGEILCKTRHRNLLVLNTFSQGPVGSVLVLKGTRMIVHVEPTQ